jgi:hypothetical protein
MHSRQSPSQRYLELSRMYAEMHREGDRVNGISADKTFSGKSLLPVAPQIRRVVEATGASRLLDYGCGKGTQYQGPFTAPDGTRHQSILKYLGVDGVHRYDPAYAPFSQLPTGKFDGVICTDVLEHCPEEDVPWIVDELFGFANMFVFASVASFPARKVLPNGENAHCTIRPPDWWERVWADTAARIGGIDWEVWVSHLVDRGAGEKGVMQRIGSDF